MITVEDLLEELYDSFVPDLAWFMNPNTRIENPLSDWDQKFLESVTNHTKKGRALSTKQAETTIKILERYHDAFDSNKKCTHSSKAVLEVCSLPRYRNEVYQTKIVKSEVRHLIDDILCFRFKYNEEIMNDIRRLTPNLKSFETKSILTKFPYCENGIWFVKVTNFNVEAVMALIQKYNFDYADEVLGLITLMINAEILPSSATIENDSIKIQVNNNEFLGYWVQYLVDCEGADVFIP